MKFLTAKLHGLGDYAAAAVLIVAPFFLGLKEQSMIAHWASIAGGVGLIFYSLLTDYTYSVAKIIPFKVHLVFDSLAGLVLIALAFVLKLEGIAQIYMIVMGAGVLLVVAVTKSE
jgi:hypothetical protein